MARTRRARARAGAAAGRIARERAPRALALALVAASAGGGLAACSPAGSAGRAHATTTTTAARPVSDAAVRRAVARATAYLADHLGEIDPTSLMLLDYAYRRWHLAALAPARARAEVLAQARNPMGGSAVLFQAVDPSLPDASPGELRAAGPTDRALYDALHCRRTDPATFLASLEALVRRGGYYLTHAAIAWQWAVEEGCPAPGGAAFRDRAVAAITRDLATDTRVTDLEMERMFVLAYVGDVRAVPRPLVGSVVRAQDPDGAWSVVTGDPTLRWHAAAVGLLALAPWTGPGDDVPMLTRPSP